MNLSPQRWALGHAKKIVVLAALASLFGCATEFPGDAPDLTKLEYPAGIALHPNGKVLYVVNANFDLKYRHQDGGTLMVVDLENGAILTEQTKTLGSFAANIVLNEAGHSRLCHRARRRLAHLV